MAADRVKEIQQALAKAVHEATGIPVHVVDSEVVDKLTNTLEEVPEIKKNFTTDELRREASDFMMQIPLMEGTIEEKVTKFLKDITTEKKYTAFVMLKGLRQYPLVRNSEM